jgi:hypothetical protein
MNFEEIECAGCGEPLSVTEYTAEVDDGNTYHPECFPETGETNIEL